MDRQTLEQKLRTDAEANKFKVQFDYLVFDRSSNLDYQVLKHFKLRELLTKNPVSHTELNLNLLCKLDSIREALGQKLSIRTSYQSPEYHLLSFGAHDSNLYQFGDAISVGCDAQYLDQLKTIANNAFPLDTGEVGIYNWGVHLAWCKAPRRWDYSGKTDNKQKLKDLITNDFMKNLMLIGAVAAGAWFFIFRKK